MNSALRGFKGPIGARITEKLTASFSPIYLEVMNESHMHSVPKDSETHFKIVCVSPNFEGKSLVERHRSVNHALADEISGGVHALSLILKTPEQWGKNSEVPESPKCRGGSKN